MFLGSHAFCQFLHEMSFTSMDYYDADKMSFKFSVKLAINCINIMSAAGNGRREPCEKALINGITTEVLIKEKKSRTLGMELL